MKTISLLALSALLVQAQSLPLPPNPLRPFPNKENRDFNKNSDIQPNVGPARTNDEKVTRYVSQLSLSELRSWTSSDGKVIEAKLIAFEDLTVEARDGAAPAQPEPPKHPTVVRDASVRLSVNRKPVILPLSRLSQADQEFVEKIRLQHAPKP